MPELENVKLNKLTVSMLQNWKTCMENKVIKGKEEKLSLVTKQNAFGELRALLNYAVKMEYLNKNPLFRIGNFKASAEIKKEMDYYTAEEFKKFIQAAYKSAKKAQEVNNLNEWGYYTFFNIAFYTGLRKGEIHGLQWNDINSGYLSVKRSVAQKLRGGDRETAPKNKSSIRTLQLPQPLIKILDEHYKRCQVIAGFNDNYKVCGGERPLRDNTINNRNKKYSELAGVKTIRIHDFRHSHASLLANEGINIQEVARRLGHSNIEMTWNVYSHLYPKEEERAIKVLDNVPTL